MRAIEYLDYLYDRATQNEEKGVVSVINAEKIHSLNYVTDNLVIYSDFGGVVISTESDYELLKVSRLINEKNNNLKVGSTVPELLEVVCDEEETSLLLEAASSIINYEDKLKRLASILRMQRTYELTRIRK